MKLLEDIVLTDSIEINTTPEKRESCNQTVEETS
jgi:hypothetical protein